MKLKDAIAGIDCTVVGDAGVKVSGITLDSRKAAPGMVFAALPGEKTDGALYAKDAAGKGASAVLAERRVEGVGIPQVIVKDAREALAIISENIHGRPSERLTLVGVTGTNGKTTTTFLLESIFREAGFSPGVVGTVNYRYGGSAFPAPHTTPEAPDLSALLKDMADWGVTHCVMEVSSHSLSQKRVLAMRFDAAVFTNLTHEHLDYHKTMEEYFLAKSVLFKSLMKGPAGRAVVNIDDPWGARLAGELDAPVTYSLGKGATVFPVTYRLLEGGIDAVVSTPAGEVNVTSGLVGEYNLQNILAAVGASVAVGVKVDAVERGVSSLKRVPGRLEKVESSAGKRFCAYVDYAHTGDALERALEALRRVSRGRIITVFGCGGNRDRTKRPVMGEVSARLSDVTIITSDNPRDEDPNEIIKEIEAGIKGIRSFAPGGNPLDGEKAYTVIPDRRDAIRKAVEVARDGDTVLIAGKGHEDYQIVKGRKSRFDDIEEVKKAMEALDRAGALWT